MLFGRVNQLHQADIADRDVVTFCMNFEAFCRVGGGTLWGVCFLLLLLNFVGKTQEAISLLPA